MNAVEQKRVDTFHTGRKPAHGATDFSHWFSLAESKHEEVIDEPYWVPVLANNLNPICGGAKRPLASLFSQGIVALDSTSQLVLCVTTNQSFRIPTAIHGKNGITIASQFTQVEFLGTHGMSCFFVQRIKDTNLHVLWSKTINRTKSIQPFL